MLICVVSILMCIFVSLVCVDALFTRCRIVAKFHEAEIINEIIGIEALYLVVW